MQRKIPSNEKNTTFANVNENKVYKLRNEVIRCDRTL